MSHLIITMMILVMEDDNCQQNARRTTVGFMPDRLLVLASKTMFSDVRVFSCEIKCINIHCYPVIRYTFSQML